MALSFGRTPLFVLIIMLSTAGCMPAPPTARAPAPEGTDGNTPPPITPSPTVQARLVGPALQARADGTFDSIGLLRNEGDKPLDAVVLAVTYFDPQGDVISRDEAELSLPWLAPGMTSPFHSTFKGQGNPTEVTASVLTYQPGMVTPAEIEVEVTGRYRAPSGGTRALGVLRANGSQPALLDGLVVSAASDGDPYALSSAAVAPRWLPPGEPIPFEATFDGDITEGSLIPYPAGRRPEGEQAPRLEVNLHPGLLMDDQRNSFIVGSVANPTATPASARILLAIRSDGALLRVIGLESDVPVAPAERRPFGARLGDLPAGVGAAGLAVQAYADDQASRGTRSEALPAQVASAESIGGSLFLRGRVSNDSDEPVRSPTLFGSLRATDGELWSAAWLPLGDQLHQGEGVDFVLVMPLPGQAELPQAEFDLRALGIIE